MFLFITEWHYQKRGKKPYFNTSHVLIHPSCSAIHPVFNPHFNTSHVLIHLTGWTGEVITRHNFNTSHVLIHPRPSGERRSRKGISIHLMFLFIGNGRTGRGSETSISIHLMFLFIRDRVGNTVNNV